MATLVWAVICERILVDQQTNLVTYVNALDGAALRQFPTKAPLMFVGTVWQRGKEERLEMRVTVYAPNGDALSSAEANPLTYTAQHKRGRMNIGLAGFDIAAPGRYLVGIETRDGTRWKEVARVPFDIETGTIQPVVKTPVVGA